MRIICEDAYDMILRSESGGTRPGTVRTLKHDTLDAGRM